MTIGRLARAASCIGDAVQGMPDADWTASGSYGAGSFEWPRHSGWKARVWLALAAIDWSRFTWVP